jgi:isopenicillin-N N-acyltransferase-like protein
VITDSSRACTANFLIAQAPDRVVDLEAAPTKLRLLECSSRCLVHTNHFLDPKALGVVEAATEKRPHSIHRLKRMSQLLSAKRPISIADLEGYLRDHVGHPYSICRHLDFDEPPEERYLTVTSAIMDLQERTLRLSDGPPCKSGYQEVSLSRSI